jgi:Replication-relaxation
VVSAERVFELARHLTERDREIAYRLYEQQVLTTDQLTLLYFSSKRRAQDRLLFLYRERVVDRFYPVSRFGAGKPQAHWLLDEAGALLVAAMRRVERKQLGWQRREDWASHPQLVHRLETNRFVADLVAATLPHPAMGVSAWYSSRDAAELLQTEHLRPDCGFILETQLGVIECWLEWDRGTETAQRLKEKLRSYSSAEHHLQLFSEEPRNILFVVPGPGRIETLRRAYTQLQQEEDERVSRDRWAIRFQPSWPVLAAPAHELRRHGPLGRVWQRIDRDGEPVCALPTLPPRRDLARSDLELALGRRWHHQRGDFWERLSPLGRPLATEAPDEAMAAEAGAAEAGAAERPAPPAANDPEADAFVERLRRSRETQLEEARRDVEAANNRRSPLLGAVDLRPSATDGLMLDPEAEPEEEPWR